MPASQTVSPAGVEEIIARHLHREGPLLPILHDLQDHFGCIPAEARPAIAAALNITQAEVHGVISFYHDFREEPAGRHVLKICRSEACQSMGGTALGEAVLTLLGLGWGETSADGRITVEPVYCLGLCACAPAAMVNGKLKGRAEAKALVAEVSA
ncbi:formate dehydrogenase subunit gamma [Maritalea mobilis]|uniref:formate dehydrogenase subunit gamma n=1 Tax=Maritalea mobilis TaxID=483324 RepID=UPI001C974944|nr:formate dehydrogenase subunit gamma [Maritalea mobilis]MBY6200618.1 formate dehydrogenase subunit gamma [Maritalea mobilis]